MTNEAGLKIIFLGNFEVSYSSENHHASTLERLGNHVTKLQEGKARSEEIVKAASDADVFIWIHTHGWKTEGAIDMTSVLTILKRMGVVTMTYHLDLWLGLERQKDLTADPFYTNIGHFFATDKLMADWFNDNTKVKGHYVPAGVYDLEVYLSDEAHSQSNDIIFVGSRGYHPEWPYRPKLIDWLRASYGSRFTHVGGDGDTGTVRGADLNKMYAGSKIAVGDTLCLNFDYPYYFSDRLFESTGRGGFVIFPYIKGIDDYFEVGKEIVTYEFDNFWDLKNKIDYYLTHDEEREAIRRAGFERTKRDHTYMNRWKSILKTIRERNDGENMSNV